MAFHVGLTVRTGELSDVSFASFCSTFVISSVLTLRKRTTRTKQEKRTTATKQKQQLETK